MIYRLILMAFVLKMPTEKKTIEIDLKPVDIVFYQKTNNIHKADSVLAIAMLLNRECPTCSQEEKEYVASCVITGANSLNISWKEYLFNKGQFWGWRHPRIFYDPNDKICQSNLKASRDAWQNPKKVRFYATKIDGQHYKNVSKKGFKKSGFYHTFSYY